MKARLNRVSQCLFSLRFHRIITARQTSGEFSLQLKWRLNVRLIELFPHVVSSYVNLFEQKTVFTLQKRINSQRTGLRHRNGRCFMVLGQQYDVTSCENALL